MTAEEREREAAEDERPPGLFRSWRGLYAAVIVYTAGLVVLLTLASRLLDHSG